MKKGTGTMMGYDWHNPYRERYVQLHLREVYAEAAQAHLIRQARGERWLRRSVGRMLISLGEALAYQPHEALGCDCQMAPAKNA
ncbi:MAG TPA: hypothetical protein VFE42_06690 [Chloroflexota bacterium]|nr:hypothetical protein [Chloroflexota bacterium]